jgi:hypothetical protein
MKTLFLSVLDVHVLFHKGVTIKKQHFDKRVYCLLGIAILKKYKQ